MLRRALLIALIAAFAVPIAAQVPSAWKVRIDGSQGVAAAGATPNLALAPMGQGVHLSLTGNPGAVI